MVVDVGLRAILEPEIDRSSTKSAVNDLEGAMKEAEKLDVQADFSDVESQMEALQGQTVDIGSNLSDAASGAIGGGGGGGGQNPLAGAAAGQLMDQASGMLGKKMGLGSATAGGMAAGGAAGAIPQVALAGTIAFGMLKGIQSIASASPAFTKTMDMFGKAMELFFRPFGRALSELLRPAMRWLIKMAKGFNDFFGGGTLSNNKLGLGAGALGGAIAGGVAGAKGGAAIGAAAGSIIPGAGTAAGGLVGGIVGAIVGAVSGAGLGAMIGAKIQELLEDSGIASFVDEVMPESITWNDYIAFLSWGGFVNPLAWGSFIVDVRWDGWIPEVTWESWVPRVEWDNWVPSLSWSGWLSTLSWISFVPGLGWSTFVVSLYWSDWLDVNDWSTWLDVNNWSTWVDDLNWFDWIDDLSWDDFIDSVDLSNFTSGGNQEDDGGIISDFLNGEKSDSNIGGGGGGGGRLRAFASGGLVTGPTNALIGEGTESEAVIPLSRLESMLDRERDRGQTSRTASRVEQVEIDTSSMESKLDSLIREVKNLDTSAQLEVDGETLAETNRETRDEFIDERNVTK